MAMLHGISIPSGMVWQYKQTIRADNMTHTWLIVGEHGAIHVDARLSEFNGPKEWIGGIECHTRCDESVAHHKHCWALNGPCQHDGSSLQFSEEIAQMLPYPDLENPHAMGGAEHQWVTRVMMNRYHQWLCTLEPRS